MYCLLLSFTWLIKIVPGNLKKKPKDCPYPILLISDLITIPDIDNDQEEDMVYWPHAGEEKEWAAADTRSGHCLIFFSSLFVKKRFACWANQWLLIRANVILFRNFLVSDPQRCLECCFWSYKDDIRYIPLCPEVLVLVVFLIVPEPNSRAIFDICFS